MRSSAPCQFPSWEGLGVGSWGSTHVKDGVGALYEPWGPTSGLPVHAKSCRTHCGLEMPASGPCKAESPLRRARLSGAEGPCPGSKPQRLKQPTLNVALPEKGN